MHLEELIYNIFELILPIKITYDPYKLILSYFNKFHGEAYKKSLYENLKIDHVNDKTVILTNYVKQKKGKNYETIEKKFIKFYVKNR